MRGAIPLLPQYGFMAWCFVKHRDNFSFTIEINCKKERLIKTKLHKVFLTLLGLRDLPERLKRPVREPEHSHSSSTEINKVWNYTSTPPYVFMASFLIRASVFMVWYLVKDRENFSFTRRKDRVVRTSHPQTTINSSLRSTSVYPKDSGLSR
jgi:hypothetical protein